MQRYELSLKRPKKRRRKCKSPPMQSDGGPAAQLPMPTGVPPGKVGGLQVPKGRQNTAGGETPGKVGGLQALKGRRNTSRGDAPAILELLRPFRACFSLFYRGLHPRLYSDVPSGLTSSRPYRGFYPRLYSDVPSGLTSSLLYRGFHPRLYSDVPSGLTSPLFYIDVRGKTA